MPVELVDHLARVVLDAVEERGLAPPQHGQAQGVEAGAVDDAAVVAKLPFASRTGTSSQR